MNANIFNGVWHSLAPMRSWVWHFCKKNARIRSGAIIFGDLFDKPCDKYRPRGRPDRRPDNALRKTNHARPDPIALVQTHPSLKSKGHQSGTSIHACNKYHPRSHMLTRPSPLHAWLQLLAPSVADLPPSDRCAAFSYSCAP